MSEFYFYMLIGVPASGKSRWTMNFLRVMEDEGIFVYSADNELDLIAASKGMTYDEAFKEYVGRAHKNANQKLKDALENEVENIIWDQTNLTPKIRKGKLKIIPSNYEKHAIVFSTPDDEEEHARRLDRPGKTIPDFVIKGMIAKFTLPTYDEGFDFITKIKGDIAG